MVDRLPPIWQLPSEPMRSGKSHLASWATARAWLSVRPASTVMVAFTASTARTRFRRDRLSTTASPAAPGTAPPSSEVLPPCGTTGMPCAWQYDMTRLTSRVSAGRTTASALPRNTRR